MSTAASRVLIFGGTFDPVHRGHLHVAESAREALGIETVYLVPCATPPHKPDSRLAPGEHRLAMLQAAVDGREGLVVDPMEIDRGGPSFTIDTLEAWSARGRDPVFLIGMDQLPELHHWRRAAELMERFDLVVVDRPGRAIEGLRSQLDPSVAARLSPASDLASEPAAGRERRIYHLALPTMDVSSSVLRRRLSQGAEIDDLVPEIVARYIRRHGLYATGGASLTPELLQCIEAARDRKAEDLVVLDVRGRCDFTDYFVICHGTSDRQVQAIADSIEERLFEQLRLRPGHIEGRSAGEWVLLDYIDIVVHVFLEEKRAFYGLERLWGDAPRPELPDPAEGRDQPPAAP